MNIISGEEHRPIHLIGLQPGEMLLESIRTAIGRKGIKNGVVISGIGTLKRCHLHYVADTAFPPTNEFYTIEAPLELNSLSGIIANGEPHLHLTVSQGDEKVYGGHLEEGSEVLYLAEVAILEHLVPAAIRNPAEHGLNFLERPKP